MFADRLRELRKAMKLSQFDLARQLNVHQTAVSHWETRRAEPDRAALSRLADFFGVTVDYLLGRDDTKKEPAEGRPIEDMDDSELLVALLGGESLELTEDMIREIKHHARYVIAREREKDAQNEAKNT